MAMLDDIFIISILTEAIWETIKTVVKKNGSWHINVNRVGAICVGLILAVGAGVDIMKAIGLPIRVPYVGMILTGVLISRGANFVHDIINNITVRTNGIEKKSIQPKEQESDRISIQPKEQESDRISIQPKEQESDRISTQPNEQESDRISTQPNEQEGERISTQSNEQESERRQTK